MAGHLTLVENPTIENNNVSKELNTNIVFNHDTIISVKVNISI